MEPLVFLQFVSLNWLKAKELNRQNNSRCLFLRVRSVFFVSRTVCLISVGIIWLLRHPWLADSGVSDFGCGTGAVFAHCHYFPPQLNRLCESRFVSSHLSRRKKPGAESSRHPIATQHKHWFLCLGRQHRRLKGLEEEFVITSVMPMNFFFKYCSIFPSILKRYAGHMCVFCWETVNVTELSLALQLDLFKDLVINLPASLHSDYKR